MTICLITANYPPMPWPCGLADFVSRLAAGLAGAGLDVTVLTSHPGANTQADGFRVHVLPGNWRWRHRRALAGWIAAERFDIADLQYEAYAFGHQAGPLLFPFGLPQRQPARILTLHSQGLPKRGGRAWRLVQFRPFDAVIFYSQPWRDRMAARLPKLAERFHVHGFPANITPVVSPGLAPLVSRVKAGWLDPAALIVYFGNIGANRGIEDLLATMAALKNRRLHPQLALVSKFEPRENSYHRSLVEEVAKLGLADRVSFLGQLPADRVSQVFQAADLVVLPFPDGASFKNGSLAAAIAHGLPVVTTGTDLTEKILADCPGVVLYRPGDLAKLTDLLAGLLANPARLAEMAKEVGRLADRVGWAEYIAHRLDVYRAAMANNGVSQ